MWSPNQKLFFQLNKKKYYKRIFELVKRPEDCESWAYGYITSLFEADIFSPTEAWSLMDFVAIIYKRGN
jgi:hypothetical protein